MSKDDISSVVKTQAANEATDKLKDLYKRKSQSAKDMFKSMQGYLSDYVQDKTEEQQPVWDTVKESIKIDGASSIPKNLALLFKTYKFGPLSGFKRMYIVVLLDLIISSMIFGAINGFFYSGLRTLFGLCAPFVTTLLIMLVLYVPLTGLANNLIALFRSYFFLHYNLDEEHHLVDELKVANNRLLKRIDPYYMLDPYNVEDSVIVVGDKNARKKTISEEYRGYLDYEEDDLVSAPEPVEEVGEDSLAWGKQYISDNQDREEMKAKNIAPDVNPLDWATAYIAQNQESPDEVLSQNAAPRVPKDKEELEVLSIMATMDDSRTLDSAMERLNEFDNESDQEIFAGMDLDELQEIKDETPSGSHPLKGRLLDKHQLNQKKKLKITSMTTPANPMAVETHQGFIG